MKNITTCKCCLLHLSVVASLFACCCLIFHLASPIYANPTPTAPTSTCTHHSFYLNFAIAPLAILRLGHQLNHTMKSPSKSDVAPAKRRRLNDATEAGTYGTFEASTSLSRPVSPPLTSRQTSVPTALLLQATAATRSFNDVPKQTETPPLSQKPPLSQLADKSVLPSSTDIQKIAGQKDGGATIECIASPVQLTKIRDLAPHQNVDTVQLKDILGNPLIKECWNFNFLFNIDFVM